jgi:alanyl-tRNA synthetase
MTMTSTQIRRAFLDYFVSKGHAEVEASPLVPRNDPTLMFTNSGMVQFKNVFTGQEKRAYTRATTAQKSVRAGGKHNDLDNVGFTDRHLTFFEMLGNFSFGDYFKEEALTMAWELVTKVYKLPVDKLWATVYAEDDEAYDIWTKKIGLPAARVVRIGDNKGARYASDNFWMMGETGPCGPCSEIFYDYGPGIAGGPPGSPDADGDRYVEIWNNVFMQFERHADGSMTKLPKPSVDTGMGLERITSVLQGKTSIWETDLLRAIIEAAATQTGVDPDGLQKHSLRVVADHLRCSAFLIAEGVLPSNEGRSYVLRRIMRRGMRHAHILGAKEPLMHKLVPTLVRLMGDQYGELIRAEALIIETLRSEELRFKSLLERGLKLLDEETGKLAKGAPLPGDVAFKLYDTFGFPLDLTQDVLRGQDRSVDVAGFDAAMAKQKAEARKAWAGSGEAATGKLWFDLKEELGATEFLGYETLTAEAAVTSIIKGDQRLKSASAADGEVIVLVNQTPFYGESGGQVGDTGEIIAGTTKLAVRDCLKQLGLFLHFATVTSGSLKVGDAVVLNVNEQRRNAIRSNHSATHLLHEALRQKLGEHVTQKGSLVNDDRLRFDISHPKAISAEEMAEIERLVNERVRLNTQVETRIMTPDEAMKAGAMALFGEKYGDEVRVLTMGGTKEGGKAWSMELCGGTHVSRTGDIGLFKVVGESAVSSGVRRVEALTGAGALAYFRELQNVAANTAQALGTPVAELPSRVSALMDERRQLEKEVADLRRKLAMAGGGGNTPSATVKEFKPGIKLDIRKVDLPARDLKPMADDLKKQIGSGIIALVSSAEGKVSIVSAVTPDLVSQYNAVNIVNVGAQACGGKGGGGRPDMAQAGGPDVGKVDAVVLAIQTSVGAA